MTHPDPWHSTHVVYVRRPAPATPAAVDQLTCMDAWCVQSCSGLWHRRYYNWHVHTFTFTCDTDHVNFMLAWHEYLIDAHQAQEM
jgi:hypothetical protein